MKNRHLLDGISPQLAFLTWLENLTNPLEKKEKKGRANTVVLLFIQFSIFIQKAKPLSKLVPSPSLWIDIQSLLVFCIFFKATYVT